MLRERVSALISFSATARQAEVDSFAHLSCDFEQTFRQIVSIRVQTLSHTNLVASMYIKREKSSLPFDVRRSKTCCLSSLIGATSHY